MKKIIVILSFLISTLGYSQQSPLLPERTMRAILQESSGASAKRNLQTITTFNRIRGSHEFHSAAEFVLAKAKEAGLADAHIERFPADGQRFYGTLKARQAWDADAAELWEVRREEKTNRKTGTTTVEEIPVRRLCSWEEMRVCLAEDSESADMTAELVDAGNGASEKDYENKEVKGKIVLIAAQGGAAQKLAVDRFGAAGMVSYALNQPQAWQGEDDSLVRWGHLNSYSATKTFAFQISLRQARELQRRMAHGERIWLHAKVKAGRHDGFYEVVTGTMPGSDRRLMNEEIVYSCHLDHQMPGANDNASGCVTLLEVARTLNRLIQERKFPAPKRTLRFVWPPEIEGTMVFLNSHPELVATMKAAIHMDMVGGSQEKTKAIFHVTRTPDSLPSFVNDVAQEFGEYVRDLSIQFASTGEANFAVHSPEGEKDALFLEIADFTEGSDHQIYDEGSFRIPSIYLNDWPDRYIHTHKDSIDNIDASKLQRAAVIGAASGYFLANLDATNSTEITSLIIVHAKQRLAASHRRFGELARLSAKSGVEGSLRELDNFEKFLVRRERANLISLRSFIGEALVAKLDLAALTKDLAVWAGVQKDEVDNFITEMDTTPAHNEIPARIGPKGPLSVFGYDYLADHWGAEAMGKLKIFSDLEGWQATASPMRRASTADYTYEILNWVNGRRSVQAIRDAVAAEFGPIPLAWVEEYLKALESIHVIEFQKK